MSTNHATFDRLVRVMRARNRTAVELREQLGVTKQAFGNWRSRGVPTSRMLEIARVLRCNPEFLRSGRGEMLDLGGPVPIHDASASALSEDALFIARAYTVAGADLRRAWRLIAEDYISRLTPNEQKAFKDALDEDLERYSGVVRLPPALNA